MPKTPRILAFAGSARKDSFNKKLIQIAAIGAREAGAEVTLLDLKDFPLPLFDQDLEAEAGLSENALKLKKLFLDHDGLLIASPEYNSSMTPLLKNTLDWVSRASPGEGPLAAYHGKFVSLMSASPGALGGLRGLVHLRSMLGNMGVIVLPQQIAVSKAHEAFTPEGALKETGLHMSVKNLGKSTVEVLAKMLA